MKILLDTCTFLWIIEGSSELSTKAKELFIDPENIIYLSIVSVWEIMVKYRLGRLPFPETPQVFVPKQRELHRIESLALEENAVMQLINLPEYHKDPFDRMLICQAIAGGLTLLTPDEAIRQYPILTSW